MYCSTCGFLISSEAKFCAQCGKQVIQAGDAGASSPAPPPIAAPSDSKPPSDAEPLSAPPEPAAKQIAPAEISVETAKGESIAITPAGISGRTTKGGVTVMDLKTARDATDAASLGTVIAAVISLFNPLAPIGVRVIMALIVLVIALGVWKLFRTAAIIAFVLACANLLGVFGVLLGGEGINKALFAPVLIFLGLWIKWTYRSVRATFAYHRFRSTPPSVP